MRAKLTFVLCLAAAGGCSSLQLRSPISATPNSGPPPTFVQTTSDTRTTRIIDVRDGMTKTAEFRAVSDYLSQKFSADVSDQHSGFLMTSWQASLVRGGAPDLRYRTRIILRFVGDDWKQVSVRAEANWKHDDEWDVGYDSQLIEEVAAELRTRIGKKI